MGFRKVNERWVKKNSGQEPILDEEAAEEDESIQGEAGEDEPFTPPSAAPATPSAPGPSSTAPATPSAPGPSSVPIPSTVSSEFILGKVTEMFSDLKKEMFCKFEEIKAEVDRKGNEIKDQMADQLRCVRQEISFVDARIDDVLLNQKNVESDLKFTGAFSDEAAKLSEKINSAILSQKQAVEGISSTVNKLQSDLGILITTMKPSTQFQSAPSMPIPQPQPTQTPQPQTTPKPPFQSSVKSGTGFPAPPTYSRRPKSTRNPKFKPLKPGSSGSAQDLPIEFED